MPNIHLILDGDNAWPDLLGPDGANDVVHLRDEAWQLAALAGGMASGKPSLALRLDLPNGQVVIAETSLAVWVAATVGLRARFPEAFENTPLGDWEME